MSFKSWFWTLVGANSFWPGFTILILIWIWSVVFHTLMIHILALSWFWRCKEPPCHLSPDLGLWRMLEVPHWGLASWYWLGYDHWSLIHPWSKFWLSILILKVQRTSMSFEASFWALEDAGGSWLGLYILILIRIWSLVLDRHIFRISALYLDFEDAKNIQLVTGLWYTHFPNWGSLSWF